jgi:hypothetical protein
MGYRGLGGKLRVNTVIIISGISGQTIYRNFDPPQCLLPRYSRNYFRKIRQKTTALQEQER